MVILLLWKWLQFVLITILTKHNSKTTKKFFFILISVKFWVKIVHAYYRSTKKTYIVYQCNTNFFYKQCRNTCISHHIFITILSFFIFISVTNKNIFFVSEGSVCWENRKVNYITKNKFFILCFLVYSNFM